MRRHILPLLMIFVFSFWSVKALTSEGYFPMHDDTQVGRVVAMGRALRNGQFPGRWVADLGYGYGYPLFNFYGPLPYYVGGYLHMLGASALSATKFMMMVGILLAGVTMYAFVGGIAGSPAGVLAGVLLVYAPYHAVQTFVRGAVGESWAVALLPLIALGLSKKRVIIGGIGLAGVVLSHTILGYVTVLWYIVGLFLYIGYLGVRKKFHISHLTSHVSLLFIGLSLSAFFWLPALVEMQWTNVAGQIGRTADFRDHFVCLPQLWNSLWGFGGSVAGCTDGMSFKLGKFHILLAAGGILLWFWKRSVPAKFMVISISVVLVATFIMLQESTIIWNILPFSSFIQYPWRMLAFAIGGLSMLGATVACVTRRVVLRWMFVLFVSSTVVMVNAKWFVPQFTFQRPAEAFETDEELRFRVSKISDEYLSQDILRPTSAQEAATATIAPGMDYSVRAEVDMETYGRFLIQSNKDSFLHINRAFFPGWTYFVNGERVRPMVVDGLPELSVASGNSVMEMHFYNTPVRSIGNLMSAVMVIVLLFVYGKNKTKIIA